MLNSTAGGCGIGMRCVECDELAGAFESGRAAERSNLRSRHLSREVRRPRAHIEVQIARRHGRVCRSENGIALRSDAIKGLEETPAPGLIDEQRAGLFVAAIKLGEALKYRSAGRSSSFSMRIPALTTFAKGHAAQSSTASRRNHRFDLGN